MAGWLTKAAGAFRGEQPEQPAPFEVVCQCGVQHSGVRRRKPQRIICRACGTALFVLPRDGYPPPQVNFLGKAATFNLMYAFPLLLLSDGTGWLAWMGAVFGWAFAGWGTTLYWWAGILYVVHVRRLVKADAAAD